MSFHSLTLAFLKETASHEVLPSQLWLTYGPTKHDLIESSLTRVMSYRDHSPTKSSTMVAPEHVWPTVLNMFPGPLINRCTIIFGLILAFFFLFH